MDQVLLENMTATTDSQSQKPTMLITHDQYILDKFYSLSPSVVRHLECYV